MTAQLTVHNAQITTAKVEIKTLTISGKQVTLAVFRQLIEEPVIADDGTLNGVPWGTVNYHPAKTCRAEEHAGEREHYDYLGSHLHVVWQKGTGLRRSTVRTETNWFYHHGPAFDLFYNTCVAASLRGNLSDRWFSGNPVTRDTYGTLCEWSGKHEGIPSCAGLSPAAAAAMKASGELEKYRKYAADDPAHNYYDERITESVAAAYQALEALETELGVNPETHDHPALIDARWLTAVAEAQDEIARRKRHADTRTALADLPQLFIAV